MTSKAKPIIFPDRLFRPADPHFTRYCKQGVKALTEATNYRKEKSDVEYIKFKIARAEILGLKAELLIELEKVQDLVLDYCECSSDEASGIIEKLKEKLK